MTRFTGFTHRVERNAIGSVTAGDFEVYATVHPDSETSILISLSSDEARLLGLALIRNADKADELSD